MRLPLIRHFVGAASSVCRNGRMRSMFSLRYMSNSFFCRVEKQVSQPLKARQDSEVPIAQTIAGIEPSDVSSRVKRLVYHGTQRGWLELDILLGEFIENHADFLKEERYLNQCEAVLKSDNYDLYQWLFQDEELPPELHSNEVMSLLLGFIRNKRGHKLNFKENDCKSA
ncbi:TPR repeat region protein [Cardiosporidium cionae]|uniref:TPR repeat region protein n=1 Tax=Cardiosporidium cionae TaxID=476202 RepID=A0ABQ7J6D9_9APIC|nr:TPR repeat region protein [Cardiosporidium cionae]|eukprot:KAF8819525.1 TPR repeat region protein [Cardiosporidium cionae]